MKFSAERALPTIAELIAEAGGPVVTPSITLARGSHRSTTPMRQENTDPALADAARQHHAVRAAMEVFDARIRDIRDENDAE